MQATERQKAYARGYWRGSQGAWPKHRPPAPPDEVLAPIIRAAQSLRDAADHICATIDPDDEFAQEVIPPIDAFDQAMTQFSEWLRGDSRHGVDGGRRELTPDRHDK